MTKTLVGTPDPPDRNDQAWPACNTHGVLLNAQTSGWVCPLGCGDMEAGYRYSGLT